jgi:hypothetical protein
MRHLLLLSFLILLSSTNANSQNQLDFGEVRVDSSFNCTDRIVRDSFPFGIENICNSRNYFEIRLKSAYLPHGNRELYILTYNDSSWQVRKYIVKGTSLGLSLTQISILPKLYKEKDPDYFYRHFFTELKTNKAFTLPQQSELKHELSIFDGSVHIITFKIGNKFRTYSYSNPESYTEKFPNIEEYKYVNKVIKDFQEIFR